MRFRVSTFSPEIAVGNLFPSEAHKEGQRRLSYWLEARGLAALVGEVGIGKTTVVRASLAKLAQGSYLPLYTNVTAGKAPLRPVVEQMLIQLGEKVPFNNAAKGLLLLRDAVISSYERNRLPVLVLDDAHHLDARALLQLKSLTNFQMDSAQSMAILLVGAPGLGRILGIRELEEIRQRMAFCYPLRGLRREEVEPYIKARLQARGQEQQVFPRDILDELFIHSQGNLRLLNQLAGFCLMAAASEDKEIVDRSCLLQALAEVQAISTGLPPDAPHGGQK
jgi:general secretion pathway protein A